MSGLKALIASLNQKLSVRSQTVPAWLIAALIALATIAVFSPVLQFEFINYDDPDYITDNAHVRTGFTKANLTWAFARFAGERTYWHPVTWLSHMLDYQLFGLNAGAHHFENVLFHALNAALLFLVLHRMTRALWRSAMVAALFALHPLQVDTVAWVTERKNVLSTLFWFLAMLAYVRYAQSSAGTRKRHLAYLSVIFFFVLGLMSKPMLVTLPCVLLLLDFWPLQRIDRFNVKTLAPLLAEKIPLFLLSGVSAVITVLGHRQLGMVIGTASLPWLGRLANVVVSYALYLSKFFWPVHLAVYYPLPSAWPLPIVMVAIALFVVMVGAGLWGMARQRFLNLGLFWFLGTLVPVIGILQVGTQVMADRFMYVPIVGLLIALVWMSEKWFRKLFTAPFMMASLFGGIVLLALAFATSRQLGYWRNSETLFRHALEVTGDNAIAQNNLGSALSTQGRRDTAEQHFRRAIELAPGFAEAYANLGYILRHSKRYAEAEQQYRIAYKLNPNYESGAFYFATVLMEEHKLDEAQFYFLKVISRTPENAAAQYQLGYTYLQQHKVAEAIEHWRIVVRLNPRWREAVNNLAWTLATASDDSLRSGKEALELAQALEKITGDRAPDTFDVLAAATAELGQFDTAVKHQKRALELLDGKDQEKAAQFQNRLRLYEERKPYRE